MMRRRRPGAGTCEGARPVAAAREARAAAAAATPDDDDAALNRAEADARDQEGDGRSDDGEDHKAPPRLAGGGHAARFHHCTTRLRIISNIEQMGDGGRGEGLRIDPLPSANPSKKCSRAVRKV